MSWNTICQVEGLPVDIVYGVLGYPPYIGFHIQDRDDIDVLREHLSPELIGLFLDIWDKIEIEMFAGCDGITMWLQQGGERYGRPYYAAPADRLREAIVTGQQILDENPRLESDPEMRAFISNELAGLEHEEAERERKAAAKRAKAARREAHQSEPGYIYVLHGGGYYKIGRTNNLDRRFTEISPRLPFEVELLHTIPTNNMQRIEHELHQTFADKRVKGEWFDLDENDVVWLLQYTEEEQG